MTAKRGMGAVEKGTSTMVKSRVIAKKQQKKQQQRPTAAKRGEETLEQAMARAHALIARQEWEQAVQVLESVLPRDAEGEARELLGVVQCEQGEVEKGREVSLSGRQWASVFEEHE